MEQSKEEEHIKKKRILKEKYDKMDKNLEKYFVKFQKEEELLNFLSRKVFVTKEN